MPASGVSIVLLAHNRPKHLVHALESVAAQTVKPSEVLVVSNHSESSVEIAGIVSRHPAFTLVANPLNSGFTGGMNLGIRLAKGEYIFLTEEDVVLAPDCVERFLEYAGKKPRSGLLSGIMVDDDHDTILSAGGWIHLDPVYRLDLLARGEKDTGQFPAPYDVGYITGAMIFAHRDVWSALGGFRDDFFIYHDDTDLSLRALRAGYRITIVPAARERHLTATGSPSEFVEFCKLRNFIALYLLHARLGVIPVFLLRYAVLPLLRPRPGITRRVLWRVIRWNAARVFGFLADRGRARPATAGAVTGLPLDWPGSTGKQAV